MSIEQEREVRNACVVIPVEISGVIGVSADGNRLQKSFYSSYGVNAIQVVAPGGDSIFQRTAAATNGRVLSTWPAALLPASRTVFDCSITPCAVYRYLQGTSMASPHVAGVAALVKSVLGKVPQGRVQAVITQTADPMSCPPNPFLFPDFPRPSGNPQTCQGGTGSNSFFGKGQVNALNAVTR